MKILKVRNLLCIFILFGLLIFAGCKDKSSLLLKEWKLENLKYSKDIPKEMQPRIERSINEIKNSYSLTYEINGKYHARMGQEMTNGTWKLNMTGSKITTVTDAGIKNEYDILELTDKKFSFRATEGKDEVIFILVPAQ